jgi:hypothetical protein
MRSGRGSSSVSDPAVVAPSSVASSGATTTPTTLSGTISAVTAVDSKDAVVADLASSLDDLSSSLSMSGSKMTSASASAKALSQILGAARAARAASSSSLSSKIKTAATQIESDWKNFPSSKSMSESIDLSGEDLSTYLKATKATADFSLAVVTTDSAALNTNGMSNFKSGAAQASLALKLDAQNLPSSSAIKFFSFATNAAGSGSLGATTVSGEVEPANLVYSYKDSTVAALSINGKEGGGKIILIATVSDDKAIADPYSSKDSGFEPAINITITVYNDSDVATYAKTWTDWATFQKDLAVSEK